MRHMVISMAIMLALLAGCSEGAPDDGTLRLTYDGGGCEYEGPSRVSPGSVMFDFVNQSDERAAANMVRLDDGYTIQDVIEDMGLEPSTGHHPPWTHEVVGVWQTTNGGGTHHWEGNLEPGTYALVCAEVSPLGVWFGAGFDVGN